MRRKIYYIAVLVAFVAFGTWYLINYSSVTGRKYMLGNDADTEPENILHNGNDSIDKSLFSVENNSEDIYDDKININTAGKAELSSLEGIGPQRAEDIINYRQTHGAFSSVEEIMNISGIGEGTFNKIKDHIII